jgi:hypothetical protein
MEEKQTKEQNTGIYNGQDQITYNDKAKNEFITKLRSSENLEYVDISSDENKSLSSHNMNSFKIDNLNNNLISCVLEEEENRSDDRVI